jgi:5-methylcytosine-specific restriction enzyme A
MLLTGGDENDSCSDIVKFDSSKPKRSQPPLTFSQPDLPRFTCVTPAVRYANDRERRGSSSDRGYDSEWKRLRGWHLKREPNCRECYFRGRLTAATMVNHVIPIQDAPELRLDKRNLSSVCKDHHDTVIRDLERLARKMDDVELLRFWLEDPSTRPHGHAYEAKGFPRLLRNQRSKKAQDDENGSHGSI